MKSPVCASKTLENTDNGPIIEVSFRGTYPPGTEGNPHAAVMKHHVKRLVAEKSPVAVLFDLTELAYVWGDALGSIAWDLHQKTDPRKSKMLFIPACVIARGRTAKALEWFFSPNVIFGIAGMRLFDNVADGLEFLRGASSSGALAR